MTVARNCIVMRREGDTLSTYGPRAQPMTEGEARAEADRLARRFPNQTFVVMGELVSLGIETRVMARRNDGAIVNISRGRQ